MANKNIINGGFPPLIYCNINNNNNKKGHNGKLIFSSQSHIQNINIRDIIMDTINKPIIDMQDDTELEIATNIHL